MARPGRGADGESIARHLPLKPVPYLLLLALRRGDSYGYTLQHEVEVLSEGTVRLDPGTLYRWLGRLLDEGWVERVPAPQGGEDDPRRRYYRLSPFGAELLAAESRRLERLVARAIGRAVRSAGR